MHSVSSFSSPESRIHSIRRKILDAQSLPFVHHTFNIPMLLQQQEQMLDKLIALSKQHEGQMKISQRYQPTIKSKSVHKIAKPSSVPPSNKSLTLKYRNQHLRKQIEKFRKQNANSLLKVNEDLKKRKEELDEISQKIENLVQKKEMLMSVTTKKSDMFELYQKMCRKCEAKRRENDELSEQIKKIILELNQLTGKEQNPNFFLMKFK